MSVVMIVALIILWVLLLAFMVEHYLSHREKGGKDEE